MKLSSIFKGANPATILIALVFVSVLCACASAPEPASTNSAAASDSTGTNPGSPASSPATTASGAAPTEKTLPPSATQTPNKTASTNEPKPQIGTGGNDLFQFTQARAAIAADPELKSASIVIDVKAGVLTLSGIVANAAEKSKAEKLVREVAGIKSVNNQLKISK